MYFITRPKGSFRDFLVSVITSFPCQFVPSYSYLTPTKKHSLLCTAFFCPLSPSSAILSAESRELMTCKTFFTTAMVMAVAPIIPESWQPLDRGWGCLATLTGREKGCFSFAGAKTRLVLRVKRKPAKQAKQGECWSQGIKSWQHYGFWMSSSREMLTPHSGQGYLALTAICN